MECAVLEPAECSGNKEKKIVRTLVGDKLEINDKIKWLDNDKTE